MSLSTADGLLKASRLLKASSIAKWPFLRLLFLHAAFGHLPAEDVLTVPHTVQVYGFFLSHFFCLEARIFGALPMLAVWGALELSPEDVPSSPASPVPFC